MNIIPFIFGTLPVRAVLRGGEPWFVAADLAAALDYSETAAMTHHLDDDEKGLSTVQTPGGPQEMTVINESGLYAAILKSRKPEAQRFRRWVTGEVLPSIRKTGGYKMDDRTQRVRDVFSVAGTAVKAQGLRGAALPELSEVRALVLTRPDGARPQVSDFRRTQPAEYVISPYTFAEVICSGLDARKVAQALKDAGHLRHETDRFTITQRLPGDGKVKVYAIKPEILH